jgi:hypothetical protein
VIFDVEASTVMDIPREQFDMPHDILSFTEGAPGGLIMGAASGGDPTGVRIWEGMTSTGELNEFTVSVGNLDYVLLGDPFDEETELEVDTAGLSWDIFGDHSLVAVTGTVGPGNWNVTDGYVVIGHMIEPRCGAGSSALRTRFSACWRREARV